MAEAPPSGRASNRLAGLERWGQAAAWPVGWLLLIAGSELVGDAPEKTRWFIVPFGAVGILAMLIVGMCVAIGWRWSPILGSVVAAYGLALTIAERFITPRSVTSGATAIALVVFGLLAVMSVTSAARHSARASDP